MGALVSSGANSGANSFDESRFKILLKYLTGNANATYSTAVASLGYVYDNKISNASSASNIRSKTLSAGTEGGISYSAKTSSQDIVLTIRNLKWTVTFLSRSTQGDLVATLWLTNAYQSAWASRSSTEGDGYGFDSGVLKSKFSLWEDFDSDESSYPSNMYGTSYVNAVTLNNGGYYSTDGETLQSVSKRSSSAFAFFTNSGFTDYLVTPRNISWQRNQYSIKNNADNNESINDVTFSSNDEGNYKNKDHYTDWADSYVWLPSRSEVGSNTKENTSNEGFWGLSVAQLASISGGTDYDADMDWTRSGGGYDGANVGLIYAGSRTNVGGLGTYSTTKARIRPCIHLNLTAIAEYLGLIAEGSTGAGGAGIDIWAYLKFDYGALDDVYKYLTGSGDSFTLIETLADSNANADYFRSVNGGENSLVKFYGCYWYPMYLSRDKNNNVILTLWCGNTLGQNFVKDETYYGHGEYEVTDPERVANLTQEDDSVVAYVNMDVGFSNGYMYAPIYSQTLTDEGDEYPGFGLIADNYTTPGNLYKLWNVDDLTYLTWECFDINDEGTDHGQYMIEIGLGLTFYYAKYFTKPRQMSWQENQSAKEILGMTYNLSNESWSTSVSNDGFYSASNNYANVSGSDAWADEYVWLPSLSEIGYSGTNGLWGASTSQRACSDTGSYAIGYNGFTSYPTTWTRSANYKQSYGYYFINSSGDGKGVSATSARVYRPCVHLNLTAIEADR